MAAKKVEKIRGVDFIWMDGQLVPWGEAKVHVITHSLHYGVAVFEGIRCYPLPDGRGAIFRLREHIRRLFESAHICLMEEQSIGCRTGIPAILPLVFFVMARRKPQSFTMSMPANARPRMLILAARQPATIVAWPMSRAMHPPVFRSARTASSGRRPTCTATPRRARKK